MSANTGVAPQYRTAAAVAAKVKEGTTTSSPGPTPAARYARCSAAVQLFTATACLAPSWRGEGLLEGGGARAHRQPARAQDVGDGVQVALLQAQVGERDLGQLAGAHRPCSRSSASLTSWSARSLLSRRTLVTDHSSNPRRLSIASRYSGFSPAFLTL